MSAPTTLEIIQLSFMVVSVVVYVWFLITIVRYRKKHPFNSSFFSLCLSLGVSDLQCLFSYWVLGKLPMFGWFYLDSLVRRFNRPLAKFHLLLTISGANQQFAGVAIMALNRCTAIAFFTKHELIWSRRFVSGMVAFQILLPLSIVFPVVLTQDLYYPVDNLTGQVDSVTWGDSSKDFQFYILVGSFLHLCLVNVASAVLYGISFCKVRKAANSRRRPGNRNTHNNQRRSENRLALIGVTLSGLLAIYGVILIKTATSAQKDPVLVYLTAWTITNDVLSWGNPWLCLLMSPAIREHMLKIIKCTGRDRASRSNQRPATHPKENQPK